jgi:signal transduction histidine kinase
MPHTLQRTKSFSEYSDQELVKISRFLIPLDLKDGDYLIQEGQSAQSLFIIEKGQVDILKHSLAGSESHVGEVLGGDIIGEMTFFDSSKRTADVIANGDVKAFELNFSSLQKLIQEDSDLGMRLYRTIATSLILKLKRTTSELTEHVVTARLVALGEMATSIAHEINNPITSVLLVAGQIKKVAESAHPDPKMILQYAQKIEKAVGAITRIVNGVRLVSRNAQSDPFAKCSLKDILESTTELCEGKLRAFDIPLKIHVEPADLILNCRATQISQVILNLVSNSCDAIEKLSEKWISIEAIDTGIEVQITITDSGLGIPKEIADKLFQPFFTTKSTHKGTGIGLSLSKRAIEDHQGRIFVKPDVKNTSFVISLPKI